MAVLNRPRLIGPLLLLACLSMPVLACGSQAAPVMAPPQQPQAQPMLPQQALPQAQPAWPQQAPQAAQPAWPQQAPQAAWPQQGPPADFNLVGIWEAQIPTDYGVMFTQMILQPNGSYSYQVVLGDLMTWETGFYQTGPGYIHFSLQNYGPTTYRGTELSRPMSWSVFYTVVDADTMVWEDRVLGSRWTVHRRR